MRGDYKQSDYGKVILPFTVLRRLDCVLEPTKAAVLAELADKRRAGLNPEPFLLRKAGQGFYNTSSLDLRKLIGDQDNVRAHLTAYVQGFSANVRDIFERFEFAVQIDRLAKANLLYLVAEKFAGIDLHPNVVDNAQMGLVFEELIRKFAELSNETAGEHFTPREVIRLMVNLIFVEDDEVLTKPGVVRTVYDPAAGTGGMLSVSEEHLTAMNPKARLTMFGQELNPESYAICKADMLIKGQDVGNIVFGNTLSDDGHPHRKFDYMLSNPPFGVEWKKVEKEVRKEHERDGFNGRFGPGLPRVSDGSMLFLMHLVSKMRPAADGGSRFGIVLNGSPLFTGGAGSGESEIRRYVLENDLVEAIIGLPTDMFYNTGISTYVWIVSNRKPLPARARCSSSTRRASGARCARARLEAQGDERRADRRRDATVRLLRRGATGDAVPTRKARRRAARSLSRAKRLRQRRKAARSNSRRCRASFPTRRSATAPSPSSARCATRRARSCSAKRAGRGASRRPIARCATPRTCRCRKTSRRISSARFCRTRRTPGSTTRRPRSATKSRSTGTSTCSSRPARWPKSTPI